ncbi:GTP cyclohydrolase II [Abyssalbus ytuae]|uniref:GTP cyclohydrolase-2 n=1 Tax=Abyssalbus ytuae TaxID=2926907 RepID=A0A9E6ZRW1_9FLAO|nr:GTP cyclohydrolase II [Abyssalbus ytuae]UOB19340.1 GTP cyclohydrolase II [Abyssalbus ytuae]
MYTSKIELIQGEKVKLPTKYGDFELIPFQEEGTDLEHVILMKGVLHSGGVWLTRIHSSCVTSDIFGSYRCDCGEQLIKSMELIEEKGKGIIVYLQQEGRGIGLMNKISAYKLQEKGLDTVEANLHLGFAPDERDYTVAAEILKSLNISMIQLLTNNPEKIISMEENGITVVERVPLYIKHNEHNHKYLTTKLSKMGHL